MIVINKLEAAAGVELNVAVTVLALSLKVQVCLVEEITAVQVPPACTAICEGKVITNFPPEEGIGFLRTIVKRYSGVAPTTILVVGALVVTDVKELEIRVNPLVVPAVPESITYPSVVCVCAWKLVCSGLVEPGLYTSSISKNITFPAAHPEVQAEVMVIVWTLFAESEVLVQVSATEVAFLQVTSVDEAL
ncbi:unnamed protein product [Moneuplotes crassus]|uniref:Uncharacterized protein n=1 Tax=Euplotes crassus TaxID=5936 RepID=A0AAD1U0V7_EUPCR|nr:unnamed protein product [Moneuplotes crassus]